MTELRIRTLHDADEPTVAAWVDLRTRAAGHDRVAGPPTCEQELRGSLRVPPPATEVVEWIAEAGDRVVGTVRMELPIEENKDLATLETLVVDPEHRGRGIGTALLAEARRVAAAHGRTRLHGTTVGKRGADHASDPNGAFARKHGASQVYTLVHNQLVVDPRPQWWDTAWHIDEDRFEVLTWGTEVPDDLVDEIADLEAVLSGEGNSGDERHEARRPAVRRVRDFERMRMSRGRTAHQMGFRDRSTGQLVARGTLSITRSHPTVGLLATAVVRPDYRRRGIGGALAAEGIRRAVSALPLKVVESLNVESNTKIRQLIAALGFVEVADWVVWQIEM
jgi:GNAT superfamily N-acetyltransferase